MALFEGIVMAKAVSTGILNLTDVVMVSAKAMEEKAKMPINANTIVLLNISICV